MNPQDVINELLVVRCMLGERPAFDELVARWHGPLWRYVRCMVETSEQAEEAAQETWVRALRGLPRLRDPGRFAPWFFGIARRVLMDRLRAKYAAAVESLGSDAEAGSDDAAFGADEVAQVREGLHRLPLIERETLMLHYLLGLPLQAIAQIAAVPEGTVKSRLFRGRRMLRESLENKGGRQ